MSCTKRILGFEWQRHDWKRLVVATEDLVDRTTDMWSRAVPAEHVICHIRYECSACGAVRDAGECTCDRERGEHCPPRLAYLAARREREAASDASA